MTYKDIPGWFDYEELYARAVQGANPHDVLVEVGCWLGKSLSYFADSIIRSGKPLTLWGVDHGFGTDSPLERELHGPTLEEAGGNTLGRLAMNLRQCGVFGAATILGATSTRAAALFPPESVQFVFLDAAHDYDNVKADLEAWWPKIKPGGMLAGHDYVPFWGDVVRAVDEFFGRAVPDELCPHCWSVVKPNRGLHKIA